MGWDLSGRDAQPSIDMLICFLVFGTPVACISCAWCAIAADGDDTQKKEAKFGGPCYFLGMFCLLVGLASQDWTTVNWDDSVYADAMVRLSGTRHNEANLHRVTIQPLGHTMMRQRYLKGRKENFSIVNVWATFWRDISPEERKDFIASKIAALG